MAATKKSTKHTKGESLEQGLNKSANKRGFSGAERHRYIGGALRNMGKAKNRPKSPPKQKSMFGIKPAATVKKKRKSRVKSK